MPSLTEDELTARIMDGTIFAISVDTAVFDRYGCNLDFPVLKNLSQFKTGPIEVLVSEIVISEVKNHIASEAEESRQKLKKSLKDHTRRWKQPIDKPALLAELALDGDAQQAAEAQIEDFLEHVGGKVVPASGADDVSGELIRRYFAVEAPFDSSKDKKHEFPDGFALLSLEAIAKQKEKLVLCVSPDKGWTSFAAQSDHVVCVADLSIALSHFNYSGRNTADQTVAMWRDGTAPDLVKEIESAFEYGLDNVDFSADGTSPLDFESEPISIIVESVDPSTASEPVVIAADDEVVSFTVEVEADVTFDARFSFFVKDWIDRDFVSLGSGIFSVENRVKFLLAISVHRDLDPRPLVFDVEIAAKRLSIDFGYVEPFQEDPTHEKY